MLNFIIYEDEEKFRDKYFSIIDRFIGDSNLAYEIIELKQYSPEEIKKLESVSGSKIYILDIEVPGKSGLDFAREIRSSGDWNSQIIIVTTHDELQNFDYQSEMLMLAFISKFYNLEEILLNKIRKAHSILTSKDIVQYQKDNQVFNFQKEDILFFEKEYDEIVATIHTKNGSHLTSKTLIKWCKEISNDPRFQKTFRTHIVNTYNVKSIDYEKGEIYFENGKIALLSKNYKKVLKDKIIIKEEKREEEKCY